MCTSFMYKIYIQLTFTYKINNLSNLNSEADILFSIFFLEFFYCGRQHFDKLSDAPPSIRQRERYVKRFSLVNQ